MKKSARALLMGCAAIALITSVVPAAHADNYYRPAYSPTYYNYVPAYPVAYDMNYYGYVPANYYTAYNYAYAPPSYYPVYNTVYNGYVPANYYTVAYNYGYWNYR